VVKGARFNSFGSVSNGLKQTALRGIAARRWHLGVTTDVLSSIGNFTATIAVARTAELSGLGMFAVAFSIYVLVTGTTAATVTDTVISNPGWQANFQPAGRRITMIAGTAGLLTVAVGLAIASPYLMIVGWALPGLAIYDHVKVISMSVWRPRIAVQQEATWASISLLALATTFVTDLQPTVTFAVWAGTGAALGLLNGWRLGIHLRPGWSALALNSRSSAGFGLDYLAGHGVAQLIPSTLAVVSGPSVVGALRGAGSMLSPIVALTNPVRSLIIPRMVKDSKRSAASYIQRGVSTTALLTVLVMALGSVLLMLPDAVGRLLLGSNWVHAEPLLPPLLCELVFIVASIVPMAGHRVAQAARRTLSIHVGSTPIRLAVVVGASALGGAIGVAWAMAGISMSFSALWWYSFIRLARRAEEPSC
jgi:O-antigen/teichoic acid export membrane protein